ncbi:bifunctional folylpolyglutamate synthase/dihydrofolate synthase [Alkaliphilus serpentinus]|uniref:bifunctional folylpolyglutamate synthase/dihydrofolate synthase n=1 Tax=Alkaliphilus serpentinus TaxID=1482731 RepID=UPI00186574F4|nr:folylpolyglutamate synthase/dihydrofolate synthase family protein [Alkaliphilus serpentinus]
MNYLDAIQFIETCQSHSTRLTIENIRLVLSLLGNPHNQLKFIHVAGTNGKGSTSSFIHSILSSEGYQVGLYTSPHLHCYTDRIRINGVNISQEEFADILYQIKRTLQPMLEAGLPYPAMFDLITLVAFVYYHRKRVDYVVFEVGLGGLNDATNVIEKSLASVITPIGIDHVDILGSTIEEIAAHKAGIIKKEGIVIYHWQEPAVEEVIQQTAKDQNAKAYKINQEMLQLLEEDFSGQSFFFEGSFAILPEVKTRMLGKHQLYNAAVAIETILALNHHGLMKVSKEAILRGISTNFWPGRLEILSFNPLMLIDGAHNLPGSEILSAAIKRYFPNKSITLVIGILYNKDVTGVLHTLLPLCNRVIFTKPNNRKATDPSLLAMEALPYQREVLITNTLEEAVATVLQSVKENEVTIFTGSLYLIGGVRKLLLSYFEGVMAS